MKHKNIFVLIFSILLFVSIIPIYKTQAIGENWLEGWDYRKNHVINNATGAGTNYQIKIYVWNSTGIDNGNNVSLGNHVLSANFSDIRFTDDDGSTLLDYWIESVNSTTAIFWVEIADSLESSAQTIYIYYGKLDETTTSSGTNTFIFFDDFEGQDIDADPSGWSGYTAYYNIGNVSWSGTRGIKARDETSGAYTLYKYITAQTGTFALEMFARVEIASISGGLELLNGATQVTWTALRENNKIGYYDTGYHDFMDWSPATWYRLKLHANINTDKYDIYVDNILKVSNVAFRNNVVIIDIIQLTAYKNANYNRYFDTFFIHKWQITEPTHGTWGDEETEVSPTPTPTATPTPTETEIPSEELEDVFVIAIIALIIALMAFTLIITEEKRKKEK